MNSYAPCDPAHHDADRPLDEIEMAAIRIDRSIELGSLLKGDFG